VPWFMTDQQPIGKASPETGKVKTGENPETIVTAKSPCDGEPAHPPAAEPATSKKLTAEEQMALYEKELKEDDWGHQPC